MTMVTKQIFFFVCEMAQLVNIPGDKLEYLSLSPHTHRMEEENTLLNMVLTPN